MDLRKGKGKLMDKPTVVLTRQWTPAVEQALAERFEMRDNPRDVLLSQEEMLARCEGARYFCPTSSDDISADFLAALPGSVKLIASYGAGVNHIDLDAARAHNVPVTNTPGVVTEDTADLTFGLIIAASRRFAEGNALAKSGTWAGFGVNFMLGARVWGRTLGIVGMGGIGEAVARRAKGFGMTVIYHNRRRKPEAEAETGAVYCRTLEDLLERADIVSLHCPLTDETHHLIDAAALSRMKSAAVLINAARGPIVDERALVRALREGTIAAAGLDVYENEPEIIEGLHDLPNAFLLPHLGTATADARDAMGFRVMENIVSHLETGRAIDEVTA